MITAYLFHAGGHDDPEKLKANEGRSFQGSIVLGMGFTFDDTDTKGLASPIAEMHRLIAKDRRNAERIFPYIGGEEVNDSPTHSHHRYVINFGEMTEEEARRWPDLIRIVEERVKPYRMQDKRDVRRKYWWRFGETTPALFRTVAKLSRVLVCLRVSEHVAFTFLRAGSVFANTLYIFSLDRFSQFATIQSRIHGVWTKFFSSTLEERQAYHPSDCFENFPFPEVVLENANCGTLPSENKQLEVLDSSGRDYYDFRAALMIRNNEGLTKTYNRFHDPSETSPDILKLRELHAAMDRAVLDAYGWHDLAETATCEFLLDYEDEEEDESLATDNRQPATRQRRKPWRYRWPDDFRDEVLARLLALNQERARQEAISGKAAERAGKPAAKKRAPRKQKADDGETPLFGG
jgi:hypothetical protein